MIDAISSHNMPESRGFPPRERDPEFSPPAPRRRRARAVVGLPQHYQRLVANPFLAMLALVGGFALLRHGLLTRNLGLSLVAAVCMAGSVGLPHFHCLDCGGTGWLFRWRGHQCERVLERRMLGVTPRFRAPNPVFQAVLWAYAVIGIGIMAGILWIGRG